MKVARATESNVAPRLPAARRVYYNISRKLDLGFPETIDKRERYTISHGEGSLEIITLEGNYSYSMSRRNVVQFTKVFSKIDISSSTSC